MILAGLLLIIVLVVIIAGFNYRRARRAGARAATHIHNLETAYQHRSKGRLESFLRTAPLPEIKLLVEELVDELQPYVTQLVDVLQTTKVPLIIRYEAMYFPNVVTTLEELSRKKSKPRPTADVLTLSTSDIEELRAALYEAVAADLEQRALDYSVEENENNE